MKEYTEQNGQEHRIEQHTVIGKTLERSGVYVVGSLSLLLGIGLVYYSARYTDICATDTGIPQTHVDSIFWNAVALLASAVVFGLLGKWFRGMQTEAHRLRLEKILLLLVLIYSTAVGGIWVAISHVEPYADARSVCVVAECVLAGDFPMQPPTYMGYCPHQYGIVFVLHCLFALFGSGNYAAFQYLNMVFLPLLIFAGYRIVKLICEHSGAAVFYLLLAPAFLPLYFFLPYVYGDFLSAACSMIVMWQVLSLCKNGKYSAILWGTLAAVLGCLVRKNTLIVVIAAVLVLLLNSLSQARWRLLFMAFVLPLSIWGAEKGVVFFYEHLSGEQISPGIPMECYVMMGLEDTEEGPGWFNGSNYKAYIAHNYDYEATKTYGREQIRARAQVLWQNKPYAVDFFRRKTMTQWNMPDCYSIHETDFFDREVAELAFPVQWIYRGEGRARLENYMNRYQFVLYVWFVPSVLGFLSDKRKRIDNGILFVAIVGGFMFSLCWEAMGRYMFTYVVCMIPMAAVGMWRCQEYLVRRKGYITKKSSPHDK